MELADGRERRARRANAGNLLQDLLQSGLEAEEEAVLQQFDDMSTDSSFTAGSDEECMDAIDSDFSDDEVEGTLEGEAVETDATARREERAAKQADKKRVAQRMKQAFQQPPKRSAGGKLKSKKTKRAKVDENDGGGDEEHNRVGSSDDDYDDEDGADADMRQSVRKRPPPTIPCETRLRQARQRAEAIRRMEQQQEEEGGGGAEAALSNLVGQRRPTRRKRGAAAAMYGSSSGGVSAAPPLPTASSGGGGGSALHHSGGGYYYYYDACSAASLNEGLYGLNRKQKVTMHSSNRALVASGSRSVMVFSNGLPPVFE